MKSLYSVQRLFLQEVQQRLVEVIGVAHVAAVGRAVNKVQITAGQGCVGPGPGSGEVHGAVAVQNECRDGDLEQVLAEIGRAERVCAGQRRLLVWPLAEQQCFLTLLFSDLQLPLTEKNCRVKPS